MSHRPASIWYTDFPLAAVNMRLRDGLEGHFGIEFTAVGCDSLTARMRVDERTRQVYGVLHGGASVVLSETLASWAGSYAIDPAEFRCAGQEINANHLRAVRSGFVHGVARPLHLGRTSQVWDVRISDDDSKLVCVSRVTMAVAALSRPSAGLPPSVAREP